MSLPLSIKLTPESGHPLTPEFRQVANEITELAARYGVKVTGYHSPELPLYSALPLSRQRTALREIKVFLASFQAVEASGERVDNNERALWHALGALGLVPTSNMFSHFGPDDVIEIYDPQGIQIWRNFNFLRICSYTLEEMYVIEWYARYRRDPVRGEECLGKLRGLLEGSTPDITYFGIPEHSLEETQSAGLYILEARHEWCGRLRNRDGELAAWFVNSKVRIVGQGVTAKKPRPILNLVPSLEAVL